MPTSVDTVTISNCVCCCDCCSLDKFFTSMTLTFGSIPGNISSDCLVNGRTFTLAFVTVPTAFVGSTLCYSFANTTKGWGGIFTPTGVGSVSIFMPQCTATASRVGLPTKTINCDRLFVHMSGGAGFPVTAPVCMDGPMTFDDCTDGGLTMSGTIDRVTDSATPPVNRTCCASSYLFPFTLSA